MAYFKGGDRGGSGGGFKPRGGGFRPGGRDGGRPSFGARDDGRDDRPKEMHDAICSSCGKDCQVPFRPSGGKPVFCRDCFSKEGGGRELGRQAGERGNSRDSFERGPSSMPMRMSASGADSAAGSGAGSNEVKRQLEQVNVKLERLISAVQALAVAQQSPKMPASPTREVKEVVTNKIKVNKVAKKAAKK